MDIHRNVFIWGQQELIKKEKLAGAAQAAKRNVCGKRNALQISRHAVDGMFWW